MAHKKNPAGLSRSARTSLKDLPGTVAPVLSKVSEAELELVHGGNRAQVIGTYDFVNKECRDDTPRLTIRI